MFEESLNTEQAANGKRLASESDQIIETRKLGRPVRFEIAGEVFTINAPSFVVADIVSDLVNDARETILPENDRKNKNISKLSDKKKIYDKNMFLGLQIILYNSRFPEWFERHDDLPLQEELDKTMTVFKLKRCNKTDLDNLINTFKQLGDPALPRNSFLKMGILL
jgi:hypothetical protein